MFLKKISASIKRGFKSKLESMDPYLIDKYKMANKSISLIDLVNLMHPKPTQGNMEAYKRLMNGESLDGLYGSKILEKEMTKAGKEAKTSTKSVEKLKEEAITSVLENTKGMPMMNLLRNLRNIILLSPSKVDEAIAQLTIRNKVLNSKLLPFRFATAYAEIEKMSNSGSKSAIVFEGETVNVGDNKTKVLKAIETALEYSVENIPTLAGNTAILIDHSGSMTGDSGGSSRVSAFSRTTSSMIGNLFGSMLAFAQKNVYIGLFGDKLINVPMKRDMGLLEFNECD